MHTEIAGLFTAEPPLDLPAWNTKADRTEYDYNVLVAAARPEFIRLDHEMVRGPLRRRGRVEICDLLGPNNELVHVKRAKGAWPLSHLFFQGLVSAQSLINSPDTRREFADRVRSRGKGRTVSLDFVPQKVVFAIMLENGKKLTADTLFPFAQAALADTARFLQSHRIEVEVIGIQPVTEQQQQEMSEPISSRRPARGLVCRRGCSRAHERTAGAPARASWIPRHSMPSTVIDCRKST